jgi:hypothetical protein
VKGGEPNEAAHLEDSSRQDREDDRIDLPACEVQGESVEASFVEVTYPSKESSAVSLGVDYHNVSPELG